MTCQVHCQVCAKQFKAFHRKTGIARCCSRACKNILQIKPCDAHRLTQLAQLGLKASEFSERAGMSVMRLRRNLRRLGIYGQWTHKRFKKYSAARVRFV